MTKSYQPLFAAGTSVPAGTTRAAPVVSQVVDARTAAGAGEIAWRITNGGALGAACTIVFQISADGANWFDYFPVSSGDLLGATITNGPSVAANRPVMYWRAIAYGNSNNACTVEAGIHLVTA